MDIGARTLCEPTDVSQRSVCSTAKSIAEPDDRDQSSDAFVDTV